MDFKQIYNNINNGIINDAFEFAMGNKEDQLFHYTNLQAMLSISKNKVIRASDYRYLNDEEEFIYIREKFLNAFDTKYWNSRFTNGCIRFKACMLERADEIGAKFVDEEDLYVTSFSLDSDSLTLWSEFSLNGVNIGIDRDRLFQNNTHMKMHAGYVIYDDVVQARLIYRLIDIVMEEYFPTCDETELMQCLGKISDEQLEYICNNIVYMMSP